MGRGAIDLLGENHFRLRGQELEVFRQYADHFASGAIHHQLLADGGLAAAKRPLPVPMGDKGDGRALGQVVFLAERPAKGRTDSQHWERAVRYVQRLDLFGLAAAGDSHRAGLPQPDVLKSLTTVANHEIRASRLLQRSRHYTGRHQPNPDQRLRFRIRQRLEDDAVDDAENQRIRADGGANRDDRGERKGRAFEEAAKGVLHGGSYEGFRTKVQDEVRRARGNRQGRYGREDPGRPQAAWRRVPQRYRRCGAVLHAVSTGWMACP